MYGNIITDATNGAGFAYLYGTHAFIYKGFVLSKSHDRLQFLYKTTPYRF